jgi:hypothetical protein
MLLQIQVVVEVAQIEMAHLQVPIMLQVVQAAPVS